MMDIASPGHGLRAPCAEWMTRAGWLGGAIAAGTALGGPALRRQSSAAPAAGKPPAVLPPPAQGSRSAAALRT
eukprot:CAMPEP_0181231886 /NCGR_PEP_ID=MMETSP1096-20121128/35383_1 /TAXON_ID=156174 ORGANISM="Chrysochromulina ericina, Strain CCMP281" /NCGR_SAMPLE_ID=MMETSP1096 /ASSEMBLY_ACC=CAM_ASM_000453 /LENGTH=72 /DNA_ID=CAMNT_0023326033 /DNA_START=369 /DNA_END=584 /DNA_ORIENTATION=-